MSDQDLMEFADKVLEISRDFIRYYAEEAYKVDPQLFLQSKPFDSETLRALVELALATNLAPRRQ